jgi:hypothetical protein
VLGRLLHLAGGGQVRNQGQVHEHGIVATHDGRQLTNGFKEGQDSMSPTVPPTSTMAT